MTEFQYGSKNVSGQRSYCLGLLTMSIVVAAFGMTSAASNSTNSTSTTRDATNFATEANIAIRRPVISTNTTTINNSFNNSGVNTNATTSIVFRNNTDTNTYSVTPSTTHNIDINIPSSIASATTSVINANATKGNTNSTLPTTDASSNTTVNSTNSDNATNGRGSFTLPISPTTKPTNSISPTNAAPTISTTAGSATRTDTVCALTECQRFHSSNPAPLMNVSWRSNGIEDWATLNRTTEDGWQLENVIRFHELATVEEGAEWTVLCVGATHIASYSLRNATLVPMPTMPTTPSMTTTTITTSMMSTTPSSPSSSPPSSPAPSPSPSPWPPMPAVRVEMQTSRDIAVGLVRLRSRCWLDTGIFAACSPSFIPLPFMMDLPVHYNSPLQEEFWINFTSAAMVTKPSWIRKLNITTLEGSILPNWIYNSDLLSLENLRIFGNDWKTPNRVLRNMSKLVHLDLSNNNIETLPEETFNDMPNLESFILKENNLSLCPTSIGRLSKLSYFDISNSNIKLQEQFEDILLLPQLHFLNISGNRVVIQSIPKSTSKVAILDMSENYLNLIPDDFFPTLPSLEVVILSKNSLHMLPIFPTKNNLTHLYASRNPIIMLTSRVFMNLKKLQILDLSWCFIQNIFGPVFQNTHAMEKVDLSHNSIKFIPHNLFSALHKLQEVNMSHNYIKTLNSWQWKFRILDLSSNGLNNFISNMSAIENVNLSVNHVQNFDVFLSSVQKLNISYNSLRYLPPDLWQNISQTLEVDLGGNEFLCCLFKDEFHLKDHYDPAIRNLGSLTFPSCYIDPNISKILFQTVVYDEHECRTAGESITSLAIVLPIVVAMTLAAVLGALTLVVIQLRKRKFVLQHSTETSSVSS